MNNSSLDLGATLAPMPSPGHLEMATGKVLRATQTSSVLPGQPLPTTDRAGGILRNLLSARVPVPAAASMGTVFSASAAPWPPQASIDAAQQLTPKERLAQAHQCVERLQKAAGNPAPGGQGQALIDQLAACLVQLDCQRLPHSSLLSRLLRMRGDCADPQKADALRADLAVLAQHLYGLAQSHPALCVPDIHTPAQLQAFLSGALNRCTRALNDGKPLQALEHLSAMREQAWRLDPGESACGNLFQAMQGLFGAIAANTPPAEHTTALRQAVDALAGGDAAAPVSPQEMAGLPAGWPEGILIPQVQEFLAELKRLDPRASYHRMAEKVGETFGLSHDLAVACIGAARYAGDMEDGLRALCWNIHGPVPLSLFGGTLADQTLNMVIDYQQQAQSNSRPLAAPDYANYRHLPSADFKRLSSWIRILWGTTHVWRPKAGVHKTIIDEALLKAGASQATGIYLSVQQLLRPGDKDYNKKLLNALNDNANCYANEERGKNIGVKSRVTARVNPPTHVMVGQELMGIIRDQFKQTVVNQDSFPFLDYGPSYIGKILARLVVCKELESTDGGYCLPGVPARKRNQAPAERDANGPPVVKKNCLPYGKRKVKTIRLIQPPGPQADGADGASAAPNAVALPTAQPAPDPRARWVRADGQPSDDAVRAVASRALWGGDYNTNFGDVHVQALLNEICARYNVSIRVNRDPLGRAPGAGTSLLLFAAPGGPGRPCINLLHQLILGEDGEVASAHYEYAVPGVHTGWQPTPRDGDCFYTCLCRALFDLGLTPTLLSVAEMRQLAAREIEDHPDRYRAAIPIATDDDLRLLAASDPDGP